MLLIASIGTGSTSLQDLISWHADFQAFQDLFNAGFKKVVIFNGDTENIHFANKVAPTITNSVALANWETISVPLQDLVTFFMLSVGTANTWVILRLER